jgi:YidC/Oxa1 family membrane protein insertase
MNTRTFFAVLLSLIIFLSWARIVSKLHPIDNKGVTAEKPLWKTPERKVEPQPPQKLEKSQEQPFQYVTNNFVVNFLEHAAAIKDVTFKGFAGHQFTLNSGFLLESPSYVFRKEAQTENSVSFVSHSEDIKVIKKFTFDNSNYCMELKLDFQNNSGQTTKIIPLLTLGDLVFTAQNAQSRFQDIAISTREKTTHFNGRKDINLDEINYIALRDQYFCAILEPEQKNCQARIKKISNSESRAEISLPEITIPPKSQIGQKFKIYLGPQNLKILNSINPSWGFVINFGTFDVISQVLIKLLEIIFQIVRNWGLAIVILSLLIYLILFPLTLKQMRSMKEMQVLQPKVEELRKLYKDNPQRMNKEVLELYREHKVNPFGGCLPLLLQMPIFFALYQALLRSAALKGAKFLWIKDLSEPDRLWLIPFSLPILGNEVNILPILMTIGMFIQQKISPQSASSASSEQQKMMVVLMPLLFGIIFYHMPAGLVLYWFVNSTLMLVYQWRIHSAK